MFVNKKYLYKKKLKLLQIVMILVGTPCQKMWKLANVSSLVTGESST